MRYSLQRNGLTRWMRAAWHSSAGTINGYELHGFAVDCATQPTQFYALTFDDPTAANLKLTRRSHGLGPYPRLEFAYNSTIYQGAGISRCLVWIHAKIVHTWRQTGASFVICWSLFVDSIIGLSDRFIGDVTWISSLPPLQQRPEALGQNSFAQILTHRLSIC